MLAIPSPDLVVNLVASAGQALGLLAVLAGRLFFWRAKNPGSDTADGAKPSRAATVALGALLVAGGVGFALYYFATEDANTARLRANLTRPSTEAGRQVGDTSLKTLGFSEQIQHPFGVSTAEVARAGESVQILDVREPEEVEMGAILDSRHHRYPDVLQNHALVGSADPAVRTLLICHSGNRSSELCEELRAAGLSVWFVVGGYEKWVAEGRPLVVAGSEGVERTELRSIPEFPNRHTLLDTPDVLALREQTDALILDVRYPEELDRHVLAGAINLPIRRMPTAEMTAALAALPSNRPIIVPCYDKRSSFYGEIVGLRLHRLGKDFRGRYTVPHEYPGAGTGERPHVAQWTAARASRSLVDVIAEPAATALQWVAAHWTGGSLGFAILLVVALIRLLVLPLSLKSDRDQVVGQRLNSIVGRLRARHSEDPVRALNARMELQRFAGLTPLRNLIGSMVLLVLFLGLFATVNRAAQGSVESWLWCDALGQPDPTWGLPVIVGALMLALVLAGAARRTALRWATGLILAVGLTLLLGGLVAAVNFYLVVNLALILLQGAWVRRAMQRRRLPAGVDERRRPLAAHGAILPLADATKVPHAGGKARRLGELIALNLPVPPGFVIDEAHPQRATDAQILAAFDDLGYEQVAVRSSGADEDGANRSFAGVFDTRLNVKREELLRAVEDVRASLRSERAVAYANGVGASGTIVVQAMVPARYAGVMFTEDPGHSGATLVEMVAGLGEGLVSGAETPDGYRFGRASGSPFQETAPPIDLAPLLALGNAIEAAFGRVQDVEWAYGPPPGSGDGAGGPGGFFVLQARDVTASLRVRTDAAGVLEAERHRLLELCRDAAPDEIVFEQDERSELLPAPTRFSAELMSDLWELGGTVDLACRGIGLGQDLGEMRPPLLAVAFGRTVTRTKERARRAEKAMSGWSAFRLTRGFDASRDRYERFAARFVKQVRVAEALDLDRFGTDELLELAEETRASFVTRVYVEAERVNIAADFAMGMARRRLEKTGACAASILGHAAETVVHRADRKLGDPDRSDEEAVAEFVSEFGHRASHDFELAQPRFAEQPERILARRRRLLQHPPTHPPRRQTAQPLRKVVQLVVDRALQFQVLKEDAKHLCLRQVAHLRRILATLGRRIGLGTGIFELSMADLRHAVAASRRQDAIAVERWRARCAERAHAREALLAIDVPSALTPATIESLGRRAVIPVVDADQLAGERVAGQGAVVARARVVRSLDGASEFRAGEILVVQFTDPDWTPLFRDARGIVSEVGGWLSHAAIQAREYDLPCIVGARGALAALRTGQLIRMEEDGRITCLDDRRAEPRHVARPHELPITVDGRNATAMLVDISASGARFHCADLEYRLGAPCVVQIDGEATCRGEVASNGAPSQFGVRFSVPLAPNRLADIIDAS